MENSNPTSILVLAGGLGSRYKSLKQIDPVHNGFPLLEYSLFDALQAGFNKVVWLINSFFPEEYKKHLSQILQERGVECYFIIQKTTSYVNDKKHLQQREKPWGTAHALLCASEVLKENFLVINADDFYGKSAYASAYHYLQTEIDATHYGMMAYPLQNTLSENGGVSRGICTVNTQNHLVSLKEIKHIEHTPKEIFYFSGEQPISLDPKLWVSMNFWLLHPSIFESLENKFLQFLETQPQPEQEFWLPKVINDLIEENKISVKVNPTQESWKGITYQEDKPLLQTFIQEKISAQLYPPSLWN